MYLHKDGQFYGLTRNNKERSGYYHGLDERAWSQEWAKVTKSGGSHERHPKVHLALARAFTAFTRFTRETRS